MKNLKKKLAKKAGFTLVELIVVIAILAILASVAVPAYTGYIQKAQESKVYSSLDALKTAVVFTATEKADNHVVTVTGIKVTDVGVVTAYETVTTGAGESATTAYKAITGVNATAISSLFSDTNLASLKQAMTDADVASAEWTSADSEWELNPDESAFKNAT